EHVEQLIAKGKAYYAFDTSEELEAMREREQANGKHSPKYDASIRMTMKNSLTLSEEEVQEYLKAGDNITVRMLIPTDEVIRFSDEVRGEVSFNSNELDDKVILKAEGLPTYHLANIVDDFHMKISHVIRGEEWLSSTAHHVLLYRGFGWEEEMPVFAHLPLILKPSGKGKLSKRDGAKFGFPVFPLDWRDKKEDELYTGFREQGYLPEAVLNFLAFLGWNPGTEQEIFSLEELADSFKISQINKSGAQFNIDKAKWYNQQYIINADTDYLYSLLKDELGVGQPAELVKSVIEMLKPRVERLIEFKDQSTYFFDAPTAYEGKILKKKFKLENAPHFEALAVLLEHQDIKYATVMETTIKGYIQEKELGFGAILPVLRVLITGSMQGPDLMEMMTLLGGAESAKRIRSGLAYAVKLNTDGQES
ncbi:MAG: glutamyl-tRNA synthetase, partial [Saprospiraceae bacterium]